MDYKYGNKNNWRRWLWNRIAERVDDPRTATVLYLAGEADMDRKIALERGFRENNLIAIEHDRRTLTTLRDKGALTIYGDFSDVVQAWPHDRAVDVVVGDFCCGLEYDLLALVKAYVLPPFFHATFAFNFLRGRDASSNDYRDYITPAITSAKSNNYILSEKHRGLMFYAGVIKCWQMAMKGFSLEDLTSLAPLFRACTWPDFRSYKSSAIQVFDSVVYRSPLYPFKVPEEYKDVPDYCDNGRGTAVRRSISAILAHRTMRARLDDGAARS